MTPARTGASFHDDLREPGVADAELETMAAIRWRVEVFEPMLGRIMDLDRADLEVVVPEVAVPEAEAMRDEVALKASDSDRLPAVVNPVVVVREDLVAREVAVPT